RKPDLLAEPPVERQAADAGDLRRLLREESGLTARSPPLVGSGGAYVQPSSLDNARISGRAGLFRKRGVASGSKRRRRDGRSLCGFRGDGSGVAERDGRRECGSCRQFT
ncbi:hypothetical protein, partial [Paenibacillus sp. P22]|uniref:hypothetical protein n=1 Tax=Paenibacillus sp. P22 TaxID=483908 RepID=UPI000430AE2F